MVETASLQTTSLGELNVTYPNSAKRCLPLLISNLYSGSTFPKVEHKEVNKFDLVSPLNNGLCFQHRLHPGLFVYRNLQSAAKV